MDPMPREGIPTAIVVMGVSACGKSSVAQQLAQYLGGIFIEADDLHSPESRQKMQNGQALSCNDRFPWLLRVGEAMRSCQSNNKLPVVACSALKHSYRDTLRSSAINVRFVHLNVSPTVARERLENRKGHFFSSSLLNSQFDTLEPPDWREEDCLIIDAEQSVDNILKSITESDFIQAASPELPMKQ